MSSLTCIGRKCARRMASAPRAGARFLCTGGTEQGDRVTDTEDELPPIVSARVSTLLPFRLCHALTSGASIQPMPFSRCVIDNSMTRLRGDPETKNYIRQVRGSIGKRVAQAE